MKRLFILLLSLFIAFPLFSASYSFRLSASAGMRVVNIEDDWTRAQMDYSLSLDALALRFDRHRVSLPFFAGYTDKSAVDVQYNFLSPYYSLGLGLEYDYSFTDILELRNSIYYIFRYYHNMNGLLNEIRLQSSIAYTFSEFFSITMPVSVSFSKDEIDFLIGIGTSVNLEASR